jgi:hypothetical protein
MNTVNAAEKSEKSEKPETLRNKKGQSVIPKLRSDIIKSTSKSHKVLLNSMRTNKFQAGVGKS